MESIKFKIKYLLNKEEKEKEVTLKEIIDSCKHSKDNDYHKCLYDLLYENVHACVCGDPNFWYQNNKYYHSQSSNVYCEIIEVKQE